MRPSSRKCSYKLVDEGKLRAIGMPENIPLRRPATYGGHQLEQILAKQNQIRFGKLPLLGLS